MKLCGFFHRCKFQRNERSQTGGIATKMPRFFIAELTTVVIFCSTYSVWIPVNESKVPFGKDLMLLSYRDL